MRRWIGAAAVAATAAAFAGAAAPAAEAGLVCADEQVGRPFLRWLDPIEYRLATGGSLESTEGWTLSGGARLVAGNEPFYVNDRGDRHSLYLPAGATAVSPFSCVALDSLVMRFFADADGSVLSRLDVDLIYRTSGGTMRSLGGIDLVTGLTHQRWAPTLPVVMELDTLLRDVATLDLGATEVAFRFRASKGWLTSAGWRIDDLYVDPLISRW